MKTELKMTGLHDRLHGWSEKICFRKTEPELAELGSERPERDKRKPDISQEKPSQAARTSCHEAPEVVWR